MVTWLKKTLHGPGGALELIPIAAPLVISFACETVMMFTDRLFLSKLSAAHMSAAMGGGLMTFTFMTLFLGIHGYASAMVAQRFGAAEQDRCPVVTTQAILIALLAYPLLLLALPLGLKLFSITGIDAAQLKQQQIYFTITMFGSIIALLRSGMSSFFSGIGRTRTIMIAAFTSMLLNVGLNYILIFGKFGCPALGIRGAAFGTIAAGAIGLLIIIFSYLSPRLQREYAIHKSFHFDYRLMKELLRTGYPAGLEMLLNLIAFSTMITAFHSCGEVVATAVTITFNWDMVSFIPMIGLNVAVTSLTGRYFGAREKQLVYRATYTGFKLGALYAGLLFIPFLFFTSVLVNLFLPTNLSTEMQQTQLISHFMVRLISLYLFADAVLIVFSGALRGVGDTFWTMVISVAMHATIASIAMVMLKVLHVGPKATWIAIISVFFFFGPILFLRFRSGRWERKLESATAV